MTFLVELLEIERCLAAMVRQFKELQTSFPTLDVLNPNMGHCHLEEPKPVLERFELFEDDSLSEGGTCDLVHEEESQEKVLVAEPIVPTSIVQEHFYEDLMWPAPPPPTLAT